MSAYLKQRAEALDAVLHGRRLAVVMHWLVLKSVANGRGASKGAVYAKASTTKTHRRLGFHIGKRFRVHVAQTQAPFFAVCITRMAPRGLDDDNLASSMKAIRDGIAEGLGVDDRKPLVRYVPNEEKAHGRPMVRVELWVPGREHASWRAVETAESLRAQALRIWQLPPSGKKVTQEEAIDLRARRG